MRYIKKIRKKRSAGVKLAIVFFAIIIGVTFWWSLKYSGAKKNVFPNLVFSEKLDAPDCVTDGGFFQETIFVSLFSGSPNTRIFYTLDGSKPSLQSAEYIEPIKITDNSASRNNLSNIPTSPRWKPPLGNVFKGTILRAITVDAQNHKSSELKRSYFIFPVKQRYSMPVISIIIDQKDFFGYNNGIYVLGKTYVDKDNYIRKSIPLDLPWWEYPANYMLRGSDEEREATIEFYEVSGTMGFRSDVGIRINGNATRAFPQKSLRICYRSKYGQPVLNYDLFPSNPVKKFNSFVLRNSGNDWNKTMFRDAFMQSLMKNTNVEVQDNRQSIVFINGEYWGIHNIRERFDQNYLANKYSLDSDSVTILELNGELVYGNKDAEDEFDDFIEFVKKNDISDPENYNYIKSKIDIQSFQDFIIANVYFCNSDWPNNNVKFWKYNDFEVSQNGSVKDGRWRWVLFDTDWGFAYNSAGSPQSDLLNRATKVSNVGVLFNALLKNEEFKRQFLERFQGMLDSTFEPAHVIRSINAFETIFAPEIQEHIDRWRAIESKSQWQNNIAIMKDFAQKRPQYQAAQLNAFFNLKGDKQIRAKNSSKAY